MLLMNEDEERRVNSKVLQKRRKKTSKRPKQLNFLEGYTPLNRFTNLSILWGCLMVSLYKLSVQAPDFFYCIPLWALFAAVSRSHASIDALILPVLVASTFDSRSAVLAMTASLGARGLFGAFLGYLLAYWSRILPRYMFICPLVVCYLRWVLNFSGASLDANERSLISCGVAVFIFAGVSHPQLPWIILISALTGYLPVQRPVKWAVDIVRGARKRGIDQNKLVLYANITYLCYFSVAGVVFLSFCISRPLLTEFFETLQDDYLTVAWWLVCLAVAFTIATFAPNFELDSRRKLWHLCSVAMFLPTSSHKLTRLALACAIALFLKLELIRAAALPPLGQTLHEVLKAFTDYRDTRGPLVISHIYLLLGISAPIFAGNGSSAGVICLGLGDTFASQIGKRYGRIRIFGHKSLEGTIAFTVAVMLGLIFAHSANWIDALSVAAITALLEATSPVNDNLVLPMFMLALERLILRD